MDKHPDYYPEYICGNCKHPKSKHLEAKHLDLFKGKYVESQCVFTYTDCSCLSFAKPKIPFLKLMYYRYKRWKQQTYCLHNGSSSASYGSFNYLNDLIHGLEPGPDSDYRDWHKCYECGKEWYT